MNTPPSSAKVIAVIPAFNEAGHVGKVVVDARRYASQVVVIDDGSRDNTAEEARQAGAVVFRHVINRGLGGRIIPGWRAALRLGADVIVTLDADGQHVAAEIADVARPILNNEADFVIGTRLTNTKGMPFTRIIANRIAN